MHHKLAILFQEDTNDIFEGFLNLKTRQTRYVYPLLCLCASRFQSACLFHFGKKYFWCFPSTKFRIFFHTFSSTNDQLRLHRPVFRTKNYGGRAFSSCAPALWNSLPLDVRSAPSVETFKVGFKTFLFNNEL